MDPLSCLVSLNVDALKISLYSIAILLFLVMSALCSASETAFNSMNIIRIKSMMQGGSKTSRKQARRLYHLYTTQEIRVINTILVINNIVNLAMSSLVTALLISTALSDEMAALISTLFTSTIVIIFGEILPKNYAKVHPEKVALGMSLFLKINSMILLPITYWFNRVSQKMEDRVDEEESVTATEDELVEIVDTIEKEGVLEHGESELIKNSIEFDEITIRTIMREKEEVISATLKTSFDEIVDIFNQEQHTRIPVLDEDGQVVAVINQKDVFEVLSNGQSWSDEEKRKAVYKMPIFISYRRKLSYALEKIQRCHEHLLIVVDNLREKNYQGIVTLEDLLEQIVGEIYDEHDELPNDILEIGNHIFLVSGFVDIDELFDEYLQDSAQPRSSFLRVNDWMRSLFRDVEDKEEPVFYDNLSIKVVDYNEEKDWYKKVEITELTKQEEE